MFHRRTVQVPPYVVERGHHGLEEVGLKTKGAGRPVSHGRTRHAIVHGSRVAARSIVRHHYICPR